MLALIFFLAVMLNYLWELLQAPLYVGLERYDAAVVWHCFVASLGDGIKVLIIAATGRFIFRRWDWFEHPSASTYLVMLATGLVLAVLDETVALHLLGRREYAVRMPTLLGIGAIPILQMLVLPPPIFRIAVALGASR